RHGKGAASYRERRRPECPVAASTDRCRIVVDVQRAAGDSARDGSQEKWRDRAGAAEDRAPGDSDTSTLGILRAESKCRPTQDDAQKCQENGYEQRGRDGGIDFREGR